jgi:localization factor PodJL
MPTDPAAAVRWFQLAANQGNGPAQLRLGMCYLEGKGVTLDLGLAYKWFSLAANQGNREAAIERDRITGALTREQMVEARRRIAEFTATIPD